MKGRSQFTLEEAKEIEKLIELKLKADSVKQKGIRNKIRKLGFYASDFGLRGGYTVQDFRNTITISSERTSASISKPINNTKVIKKPVKDSNTSKPKKQSDEAYIIDLCDEVLKLKASRQHRFDFLKGDTGVKLPVDAYYISLNLVVEYYERQHTEAVLHFDKRMTVSGMSRGEQRKRYDERRRIELPKKGIKLIIFDYSEFEHYSNKRLVRNKLEDIKVIKQKLLNKL
ncbi:hypothetical protein GCM10022271_11760 [Corallibacter vietnamensis]|uniref:WYL domain-containing protein n=1 Tax=Corallibacter vietnamensis TaxID=904130 RepID=A0ABP7H3H9_9FLAO